ncbi:MAG: hypothetical protein PHX78_01020 [bacterium]|nr:hypothetical protein [bacterium]
MKKENIITAVFIYIFIILRLCSAQESNSISGKVKEIDGESVYIEFDKSQSIKKGTIFGIYDPNRNPVAVCEITKFHFGNSYLAFILVQVDDVKEGYSALSNIDEEKKLRKQMENGKGEYYDFFKTFAISRTFRETSPELAEDFLLYQLFTEAIKFLKLDIYYFRRYDVTKREEAVLNMGEKKTLDIYRDIISEGKVFNFNRVNGMGTMEVKINLGKLKNRLRHQGYSLKPKIIRLVFTPRTLADDIRLLREILLENSVYVSVEEAEYQDVTSPVSCIIYTTPKILAEEINGIKIENNNIFILINKVEGDTINLDIGSYRQ